MVAMRYALSALVPVIDELQLELRPAADRASPETGFPKPFRGLGGALRVLDVESLSSRYGSSRDP